MKFFAVFAAVLAVACGAQSTWTLQQLSDAIQSPATDPAVLPYLEQALDEMMAAIYAGEPVSAVTVTIPPTDLSTWTLHELSEALQNPETDAALVPYLEAALNQMMEALISGQQVDVVTVAVPAFDVSSWTLQEIDAALSNPATDPALVPYLEHALNDLMEALISGQQLESITIATPAGLLPVESPVQVPVVPAPVEAPIVPAPVEAPAVSSPLVQIIVNIKQQDAAPVAPVTPGGAAAPLPEIQPTPVIVVDQAVDNKPEPITVVDQAPIPAEPVIVVDQINPIDALPIPGIILPSPVVVAPLPAVVGPMI